MEEPKEALGELVFEVGDFKFYRYRRESEALGKGITWEVITVVNQNKELKLDMVKVTPHTITVEVRFQSIDKSEKET